MPFSTAEKKLTYGRGYRAKNRAKLNASTKAYHRGDNGRNLYLLRTYGITLAERNAILDAQDGRCGICGRTEEELGARLHVDHEHPSGGKARWKRLPPEDKRKWMRGLLCYYCNRVLLGKLVKKTAQQCHDFLQAQPAYRVLFPNDNHDRSELTGLIHRLEDSGVING